MGEEAEVGQQLAMQQFMSWQVSFSAVPSQCYKRPSTVFPKAKRIADVMKGFGAHGGEMLAKKVQFVEIRSSSPRRGVNYLVVMMLHG